MGAARPTAEGGALGAGGGAGRFEGAWLGVCSASGWAASLRPGQSGLIICKYTVIVGITILVPRLGLLPH